MAGGSELGLFLRNRRARIDPEESGFPVGRRRTQGLRREEVALLAGVSPTWYAYLEQGRPVRPSPAVLDALARALALNEDERRYVHLLAFGHPPAAGPREHRLDPAALTALMGAIGTGPAPVYLANQHTDLLAWNPAADVWYGGFQPSGPGSPNLLRWLCTSGEARRRLVHWERETREAIARFRSAAAARPHDPAFADLAAELERDSPEFRRWWADHEVREQGTGIKELQAPGGGRRRFQIMILKVAGDDFSGVVVHVPVD